MTEKGGIGMTEHDFEVVPDCIIVAEDGSPVAHLARPGRPEDFPETALCGYRWRKDWAGRPFQYWELQMDYACQTCRRILDLAENADIDSKLEAGTICPECGSGRIVTHQAAVVRQECVNGEWGDLSIIGTTETIEAWCGRCGHDIYRKEEAS